MLQDMTTAKETMTVVDLSELMDQQAHDVATPNAEVTALRIADVHCQLGECILYDDVKNVILWTDIMGQAFYQLSLDSGSITKRDLPQMLCAFAMRPPSLPGYLCAWEDGFELYDLEQGTSLSSRSIGPAVNPKNRPTRLNDGRCHPNGRDFICGGFYGELTDGTKMKVYRCSFNMSSPSASTQPQLVHETIVDDIEVTNSICFAPATDGTIMYLADSPTRQIHAYRYNANATSGDRLLSEKRLLNITPENLGFPDGSCVDAQGFLWNAVWRDGKGPGRVQRIDPQSGQVVATVHVPDTTSQVSCCCFGGPDLNILFMTSAAVNQDNEPHAGAIYAIKLNVQGIKEARFG